MLCERIVVSVEDWENYNQARVHECAVVSGEDREIVLDSPKLTRKQHELHINDSFNCLNQLNVLFFKLQHWCFYEQSGECFEIICLGRNGP